VAGIGAHLPDWLTSSTGYRTARAVWHRRPRRLTVAQRRGRLYDQLTVEIMASVLERDSVCIDVGASTGALLRHMCELAPAGRHLAFEPRPGAAEHLQAQFPTVRVYAVALAAEAGESEFTLVASNPAYSGLRPRRYDRPEKLETITVPVCRLDDLVPDDLPITFMKIDVEGGEVGVVNGALKTLRRCKPLVAFEHGGGWATANYGTHSGMLYDLLASAGLQISLLDDWMNRRPPLSVERFIASIETDHEYFFLAHPPRGTARKATS